MLSSKQSISIPQMAAPPNCSMIMRTQTDFRRIG